MISILSAITDCCFFLFTFILFYLSVKKCFWKGDRKKAALFSLSFFTNPITTYFLTLLFQSIILYLMHLAFPGGIISRIAGLKDVQGQILYYCIAGVLYLILLLVFSGRVAKWLHAKNRALVVFVYMMYGVIMVLTMTSPGTTAFKDNPDMKWLVNLSINIVMIIAMLLIHFLIISNLSKFADENYNTDRRVFVLPPALFIVAFSGVVMPSVLYNLVSDQSLIIMFCFSVLVAFLFIWAFYVIIKNIKATAEAIKAKDEVKTLSVEVMEALAHTIDAKDEYTKGHSIRVANYSRMIAGKMGFSEEECENIYYMGLLHDLGKIGVPNEIINSPTKLTDDEFAVVKTHPGLGYDILSEMKSRPDLVIGARWHHERFDGGGYPDEKGGEDIPIQARIIAVADSYDAMTSNRSYRNYMPQDKVRAEIENNSGSQFDPNVAACMLKIIDEDVNYELHE